MQAISSAPVLILPDIDLPFENKMGASRYDTGAILYQRNSTKPQYQQLSVIGYHLYTFSNSEVNYKTTEKEVLTLLKTVRHFS